uniref:Uncharacterized protein n=1 Tax=Lotharella oceanica TaxID=641309 RepID=A0A7S2TY69_9EUKA
MSALQVEAPFVGFRSFEFWRSGTLLFLNTFLPTALCSLSLVLFSPSRRGGTPTPTPIPERGGTRKGRGTQDESLGGLEELVEGMNLLSACSLFCNATNVYVNRHHLMVWAVFAPKFLFEAILIMVTSVCRLLLLLLLSRG